MFKCVSGLLRIGYRSFPVCVRVPSVARSCAAWDDDNKDIETHFRLGRVLVL